MPTTHKSGFVAGTWVHTDKGLVAINKLKVGDKVLSGDENNPDGELTYKKVLSTFKSAQKQKIIYVEYSGVNEWGGYLFCKENYPFWIDRITDYDDIENLKFEPVGWTPAIDLQGTENHVVRTLGDDVKFISTYEDNNKRVVKLECNPDWAELCDPSDPFALVDFSSGRPTFLVGKRPWPSVNSLAFEVDDVKGHEDVRFMFSTDSQLEAYLNEYTYESDAYQDYVYNIEVEDYHTYFVGREGVWVKGQTP